MNTEKIEAVLTELQKSAEPYLKTVQGYLHKAWAFIKSHKVLTSFVAVVLAICIAVSAIVYNILDLINYDDGSSQTSETTAGTNGMQYLSYTAPDGSLVFNDGSYMTPTGAAVLYDGTTIYPTGIVAFTDGSYIVGSGIALSADGTATLSDARQLHISQLIVGKDGNILVKNSDGSTGVVSFVAAGATLNSNGSSVTLVRPSGGTSQNAILPENLIQNADLDGEGDEQAFDTIMENIYDSDISDDIKQDFQQNDAEIDRNLDDNQIWYSDSIQNILLLGIDNNKNSDAMIVLSINKDTKDVKLVSFSRVVYAAIEGYGKGRLNHAHRFGGVALVKDAIEKNYKIRIDNYVSTTIENFMNAIECIGGVDIGLTQEELDTEVMQRSLTRQGYTNFQPNVYNLNGYSAMNYVRLRSIDSDRDRTQRQRNVLEALVKKVRQMSVLEIARLIEEIFPLINTDLTKGEILSQLANVYSYLSSDIKQYVVPFNNRYEVREIEGFGVMLIDWEKEVSYTHDLFYAGVEVKYKTF